MSTVTPTITSAGQILDPAWAILSIEVRREVDRIPRAEIVLIDGDAATRSFAISDAPAFEPGEKVEIKLRYEGGEDETVFKGLVICHRVESSPEGSTLTVEMKDAAVKLTGPRRSAVFRGQTDSDAFSAILSAAGVQGTVAATSPKHPELVQFDCSDWDFVLSRSRALGLAVAVLDGEVSVAELSLAASPKHTFEWGISEIHSLEMAADAGHQFAAVESFAWDLKQHKLTQATQAQDFQLAQGNLKAADIAGTVGFDTYTLPHPVPTDPAELTAWADGRMTRDRLALLRGCVCVPGFADVVLLDVMEVAGVGKRFNGKTLVTGLCHRLDASGWQTTLQFGLRPERLSETDGIARRPAAGLLPPTRGLQIGVVAAFEEDPDTEYRAKVLLPAVDEKEGTVWARLTSPDAGKGRGFYFRPEAGDEVIVGFLDDDPRHPVILGALFGSANTPPADLPPPAADNFEKAIVTRAGTTLAFLDEDKPSVFIETKGRNKILLSDDLETVHLSDQHENAVTLDKDGITIHSAKDLKLSADGNVEIEGAKVDIK